jgi:ABC-2 type transport system permease protein
VSSAIAFMIRLQVRARMAYRVAFLLNRLAQIIAYASAFSAIWVLIHKFSDLGGWRWPELALLLSFQLLAYGIGASLSFTQMRDLEETIRSGKFDTLLVKPMSPWAYLVFSGLNLGYIGHIVLAIGMLAWSLSAVDIHWNVLRAAYALASLVSSAALICALLTMIGSCAFLMARSRYLYGILFGFWELVRYPLNVFPAPLQWLLLTALPMGFLNYVPVSYLLGKETVIVGELGGLLAPLAGPVWVGLAMLLWRFSVRRYQGAGG